MEVTVTFEAAIKHLLEHKNDALNVFRAFDKRIKKLNERIVDLEKLTDTQNEILMDFFK